MQKEKIEDLLSYFKGKELKNKPLPPEFWEKQGKMLKESNEEAMRVKKALTMSYEKFHKPFTC